MKMLQGERPDVEVMLHDSHSHADFIRDLPWQDLVVARVVHMAATAAAGSSVGGDCTRAAAAAPGNGAEVQLITSASLSAMQAGVEGEKPRRRAASVPRRHGRSDSASSWQAAGQLQLNETCTRKDSRAAAGGC